MKIFEIDNETIFTLDWARDDPRSVMAYLAGRGDGRTYWWNLNQLVHQTIKPDASLETVMYSFHTRHHRIAIAVFSFVIEVGRVAAVIRTQGLLAGAISALKGKRILTD